MPCEYIKVCPLVKNGGVKCSDSTDCETALFIANNKIYVDKEVE